MTAQAVAAIWWPAGTGGGPEPDHSTGPALTATLYPGDVITFGRSRDATIRFGHAPVYNDAVPREWGQLEWKDGRLEIRNVDDRWSIDLVPHQPPGSRRTLEPQAATSPAYTQFDIVATATGAEQVLHVRCLPPRPFLTSAQLAGSDPADVDSPSNVGFEFTPTQRRIAGAILAGAREGRPRRLGYLELADLTHYGRTRVKEVVLELDATFLLYRLASPPEPGAPSDALDRVTAVLSRHPGLLG